ncbi:hypothetical protein FRC02_000904 [Tulasnella sp. 418]|nr:hypothetical protein FRC02_000904 [Tulasnella sp. 418]
MSSSTPISPTSELPYQKVALSNNPSSPESISVNSKSPSFGPPKSIGFAALLPFATVMLWSWGMGSGLLIWLLVNRISPPGGDSHVFDGYIVVDEGNKTGSMEMLDGQESLESTMMGVLIITAVSHFASMAVVPLMALGAFYVAAQWLDDQALVKDGPTPLQFGLAMQMCSTGTWDSVLMTLRYLFRRWKSQSRSDRLMVSNMVYRALNIAIIVVVLRYSVIFTDLLLSADLGSAYYQAVDGVEIENSTITHKLGTQYNPNHVFWEAFSADVQWLGLSFVEPLYQHSDESQATIMNTSTQNHIVNIYDITSPLPDGSSSMAVIGRPPSQVSPQWSWSAPTIGMSALCEPAPCDGIATNRSFPQCPTSTYRLQRRQPREPLVPIPSFDFMPYFRYASVDIINYNSTGDMIPTVIATPTTHPPYQYENPSYYVVKIWMEVESTWSGFMVDDTEFGILKVWYEGTWANESNVHSDTYYFYNGVCKVTLYDIDSISFNGSATLDSNYAKDSTNSRYSLTSIPRPMSADRATEMISPVMVTSYNQTVNGRFPSLAELWIMPSLRAFLARDAIYPGFSSKVASELARSILACVAALNVTHLPASTVVNNSAKLVSRYPLARTAAYIAIVYAHGLVALVLFMGIVRRPSRTVVVDGTIREVNWKGDVIEKKQPPVQELVLVQSRLTDPLVMVAEHFLEPDSDKQEKEMSRGLTTAGTLSAQQDAVGMFDVEGQDTNRINIGLIDREDGERWYGLSHRRKERLVKGSGKDACFLV